MKKYKEKKWLEKQYLENKLSTYEIAKLCNITNSTICCWLEKFNIQIRNLGDAFHVARGNHCNLSNEAKQWIDGELLGDGCLKSQSKYSAIFSYSSKYKEYINYVSDTLNSFGIKRAGKILIQYDKGYNCYTYKYASLSYAELLPIRERWYPNEKKIIPRDLELTPLVLRQEMIGDGSLIHAKKCKPYISFATTGFLVPCVEWLVEKLNKLGFKSTRHKSDNSVYVSTKSTKDFINYIGKCPVECYQYKFNYIRSL